MIKIFIGNITAIQHYIFNMKMGEKTCIITDNPIYYKLKSKLIFTINSLDKEISLIDIGEIDRIIIEVNHLLLYLRYRFGISFMRRIAYRFFENFKSLSIAKDVEIWIFLYKDKDNKVIFMPNWILAEKFCLDEDNE